jgi:hypothetical protein
MRIFNLQAEIDLTSHHSFLRLKKVKKINLKLPYTKKNPVTKKTDEKTLNFNTVEYFLISCAFLSTSVALF